MTTQIQAKPQKSGDPRLTLKLRSEFSRYQVEQQSTAGGDRMSWPEWLEQEGYGLDGSGHVFKVSE